VGVPPAISAKRENVLGTTQESTARRDTSCRAGRSRSENRALLALDTLLALRIGLPPFQLYHF